MDETAAEKTIHTAVIITIAGENSYSIFIVLPRDLTLILGFLFSLFIISASSRLLFIYFAVNFR